MGTFATFVELQMYDFYNTSSYRRTYFLDFSESTETLDVTPIDIAILHDDLSDGPDYGNTYDSIQGYKTDYTYAALLT